MQRRPIGVVEAHLAVQPRPQPAGDQARLCRRAGHLDPDQMFEGTPAGRPCRTCRPRPPATGVGPAPGEVGQGPRQQRDASRPPPRRPRSLSTIRRSLRSTSSTSTSSSMSIAPCHQTNAGRSESSSGTTALGSASREARISTCSEQTSLVRRRPARARHGHPGMALARQQHDRPQRPAAADPGDRVLRALDVSVRSQNATRLSVVARTLPRWSPPRSSRERRARRGRGRRPRSCRAPRSRPPPPASVAVDQLVGHLGGPHDPAS